MILLQWTGKLGRFAVGMTRIQRRDIGVSQHLIFGKFGIEPINNRLTVAVEHPQRKAERPHILAAQRVLITHAERLDRLQRQRANIERQNLPFGEAAIVEWVGGVFRLVEIPLVELTGIGND